MKPNILAALSLLFAGTTACVMDAQDTSEEVDVEGVDQAFQKINPVGDTHSSLTNGALFPLIESDYLDELRSADTATDDPPTKTDSRYHVDNCRISEAFASVRGRYDQAVEEIASGLAQGLTPDNHGWRVFGSILHTVQDFYAHSNWVDAYQHGLITDRFDFDFPALKPGDPVGTPVGSMVVLEAGIPKTWQAQLVQARLPTVTTDAKQTVGLITGTYPNGDGSACLPNVSIPHGTIVPLGTLGLHDNEYLSKDDSVSTMHKEALDAAGSQTIVEVCRLARLIRLRKGRALYDRFVSTVVSDRGFFEATCGGNPASSVTAVLSAVF